MPSAFMTGDSETIWAHSTGLVDGRTSSSTRRRLIDRLIRGDRCPGLVSRVIVGSMQAISCQRGGFSVLEDITACAFKRDSKLIWSVSWRIPRRCCGDTSHPAGRRDWRRGFLPQISAAIRRL